MEQKVHPSLKDFAYHQQFITADAWRILKIMGELVNAFDTLGEYKEHMVSVFGSARFAPDDPMSLEAEKMGRLLVENGYGVITGGGPGIMRSASKGAHDANGLSVGLNIQLPHEQQPNPFQNVSLPFHYFFNRKTCFLKYTTAVIVFPGGFGTMDEFFETVTMIQTEKMNRVPVILVGKEFFGGLVDWLRQVMYPTGAIDTEDFQLFKLVEDAEEAIDYLLKCHSTGITRTTTL